MRNAGAPPEQPIGGPDAIARALGEAGRYELLRARMLDALRQAECTAEDPQHFREHVRWPIIAGLLENNRCHRVELESGLLFEVAVESRIERALLLSREARPDHVWEPQTTRLLTTLARGGPCAVIGGAYIGDQALPVAEAMARAGRGGIVLAYEPMPSAYKRLIRNIEINGLTNVRARSLALWDRGGTEIVLEGPAALASPQEARGRRGLPAVSLDEHLRDEDIEALTVIMLDLEGGEERALRGAHGWLSRPPKEAPHVIFEVHRSHVDWSAGLRQTPPVRYLVAAGYEIFAIRDFQDNVRMSTRPIEVIPLDSIYLEGPPHGFNLLATKDPTLHDRLGLKRVWDVSPKLLMHGDPRRHHPLDGLPV